MVASTVECSGLESFNLRAPVSTPKAPFTLEIIMCLTLNSAEEWAGSMFQVETPASAEAEVVAVVIVLVPFTPLDAAARYSLQQLFFPDSCTFYGTGMT